MEVLNKKTWLNYILYIFFLILLLPPLSSAASSLTTFVDDYQSPQSVSRVYEISPALLDSGSILLLQENDTIHFIAAGTRVSLFISDISNSQIILSSYGHENHSVTLNASKVLKITGLAGTEEDIEFFLKDMSVNSATLSIKKFTEQIPFSNYSELFDVELGLTKDVFYSSEGLTFYVKFFNMGEGASYINISYWILDEQGKEIYRGIDGKAVYTEGSIVKNLDFLNLPIGKYKLGAKIDYGINQTASSEKSFEIIDKSFYEKSKPAIFMLTTFIIIFIILVILRKFSKK